MDLATGIQNKVGSKDPQEVEELILDSCKATKVVGLDTFTNLKVLLLNGCGLTTLEDFPQLPKLKCLELSDNKLSDGLEFLQNSALFELRRLSLANNKFATIDDLIPLQSLPALRDLDLFNCPVTSEADYRKAVFEMLPELNLRRLSTAAARDWQMLPSGLVRWTPLKSGEPDAFQVKRGHVVRLKYVARLDDGSELSKGTLSFRLGNNSDGVCAAVDEACTGMRLGDSRRVRAAPGSRRSKALAPAPTGEMLEYDLTLTGVVAQRTIMTIEDQASEGINPFNLLADLGKRSVAALYGPVAGLLKSREKPEPPKP